MKTDSVAARELSRSADGTFGQQARAEVMLPDLMAAAEGLRRTVGEELHQAGLGNPRVSAALDEALRRHENRVIEILSGHDRAAVDQKSESVLRSQGYEPATEPALWPDPHVNVSPKLGDSVTSALLAWRTRDKSRATPKWIGSRLRLQAYLICKEANTRGRLLNRAQRARIDLLEAANAEAEAAGDDHEVFDERLAQLLTPFAHRV